MITDDMLNAWTEAERQRTYWVDRERELRQTIFKLAFPTPRIGMNNHPLPHGYVLKAKHGLNYKIDRPAMEAAIALIPTETFEKVIAYRPEVRDGAYRDLSPEQQKPFQDFLTTSPKLPEMEIAAKKK